MQCPVFSEPAPERLRAQGEPGSAEIPEARIATKTLPNEQFASLLVQREVANLARGRVPEDIDSACGELGCVHLDPLLTCANLPERDREAVKSRLRQAWKDTDHDRALEQLNTLALELDHAHPGAAASLREGIAETLTVTRLGITGKLKLTLQSTNPIESMISTVRVIHRNVKHWSSGEMCLRWTAAGMLEAETRFRKVQGYRGLAHIAIAIERDLTRRRNAAHQELTAGLTV